MKRKSVLAIACALVCFNSSLIFADEFGNNFSSNLTQDSLDALAKDLGALMGGGSFHDGKALGFPLGFDIGVHVPVVGVSDKDKILRDDGSTAPAVWAQAEVGLPFKLNLIGRLGKMYEADLLSGGLKLGLIKSSVPGVPNLSVSALYSVLDHDFFKQKTLSANAVVSFALPIVHPYIGAGYDSSTLDPKDRAFEGVSPSISRGLEGEADGVRVEAGVDLSFIPFTYVTLGVGLANSQELYHAGLGLKF